MLDFYVNGDCSRSSLRIERNQRSKDRKERRRLQLQKMREVDPKEAIIIKDNSEEDTENEDEN